MNIEQLLNGIVVVIDDEIDEPDANINKLVAQLNERNYPVLKYTGLEGIDVAKLGFISFLLLDWELGASLINEEDKLDGVKSSVLQDDYVAQNINFIKNIINKTFCPVFIFSNQDVESIKTKLIDEKIIDTDKSSRIFIKSKRDVENSGQLFTEVEAWLKKTPSMYVLKKWENEHLQAINTFFNDFQNLSPFWPIILWDCYKKDEANSSLELAELLTKNLQSRMLPFHFCEEILTKSDFQPQKEEIRKVLEGERFLSNSRLHGDVGTGDIFKISDTDYLLNIRPQCDLLRTSDAIIYCIQGKVVPEEKENSNFSKKAGQFEETVNKAIIPFLDNGKRIDFSFKEIIQKKFSEEQTNRIGRLLPPYITRIQQRFALYLQRQGLPRIPVEAFE